ncbi:hypothetical protein [Thermophilibacter mediterraneus]|uniref:hypothetical protein n=1 Tax=Thermophilibacter mediterraneus TaxID=1871031 RepID=UPI00093102DB|nr:hypothetical protein [Thermophilibacter mediterraneus]
MDVPHWPYWKKNSLGGTQVWYADWGDRPFDAPDMGERDEEAVHELKRLAERYGSGRKDPERDSRG